MVYPNNRHQLSIKVKYYTHYNMGESQNSYAELKLDKKNVYMLYHSISRKSKEISANLVMENNQEWQKADQWEPAVQQTGEEQEDCRRK